MAVVFVGAMEEVSKKQRLTQDPVVGIVEEDDVFAEIEIALRSVVRARTAPASATLKISGRERADSCISNHSSSTSEGDGVAVDDSPSCSGDEAVRHIVTHSEFTPMNRHLEYEFFPVAAATAAAAPTPATSSNSQCTPAPIHFLVPTALCSAPMCAAALPDMTRQIPGGAIVVLQATPSQPQQAGSANKRTPLRKTAAPYISVQERLATAQESESHKSHKTSLLLRNLPKGLTRSKLFALLRGQGLAMSVDFMYLPTDLKSKEHFGYAFVNFTVPEAAEKCLEQMQGFSDWGFNCENVCEASWCTNHSRDQGLDAHIERYRNSRIMHESVNDEHKPALFRNGSRIPFPRPTRPIRAPRLRKGQPSCE